jgi:hypothetical protein
MFNQKWVDSLFAIEGKWRILTFPIGCFAAVMFGFVDWLRGFMRPALTLYLTGLTTVITWMAWDIMKKYGLEGMTAIEAVAIFNEVITIVVYLTVSCVTWWFGDRRIAKFLSSIHKQKSGPGGSGDIGAGSGPL